MSLLVPDTGLLIWMTLSFGVVLCVLVKFGFPIITKAVEKRSDYISNSLESARKAEAQYASMSQQAEAIIAQARGERNVILSEAQEAKNTIVSKAREDAEAESRRRLSKALEDIEISKKKALGELRKDVVAISVRIAEKVIGEQLKDDQKQQELINKLLAEEIKY
jgi:F-type H+-transporting ATPase subunit b